MQCLGYALTKDKADMKFSTLYIFIAAAVLCSSCTSEEPSDRREVRTSTADTIRTRPDVPDSAGIILFLGNSLSAGLGVDPQDAFPHLIQERIDSLGWNFRVVNAGLSGETSSGGLRRIDWLLQDSLDVLVLELGGNDGLRGIPIDVTRENLAQIIEKTRAQYPDVRVVLAGMQIPPNLGHDYTARFREMYPDLADEYATELIPFLLDGVGGVDSLMQSDGIHPTAEGHEIIAENVWSTLKPMLEELRGQETVAARAP